MVTGSGGFFNGVGEGEVTIRALVILSEERKKHWHLKLNKFLLKFREWVKNNLHV